MSVTTPNHIRIVFMGTSDFAVPALHGLVTAGYQINTVVTQPDRPAGRGRASSMPAIKQSAMELGLPVWQPERIRAAESIERLRAIAPDLVVVAAFGQILPKTVLEIPAKGCLNLHGSLLPRLRGASPIAFAILEGHAETGVTVMLMDPGMDTGPILAQRTTAIVPDDTSTTLGARLGGMGAKLLAETLPGWLVGQIVPQVQDNTQATYTRIIAKEDGRIDWGKKADEVCRQVRAFDPWPGSYTFWNGKRLKLLAAHPIRFPAGTKPGSVVQAAGDAASAVIVTADGGVIPLTLQLEGKRAMSLMDFLRGQPSFWGAELG